MNTYNIYLSGEIELEVKIQAGSLEDAIKKADNLNRHSLFSKDTYWNDGDLETIGILKT